jgi:phage-related minor tail protein
LAIVLVDVIQPLSAASWFHAILEVLDQLTAQRSSFVIEVYFKNGESAVKTQRLFRRHFNITRNGRVTRRNTINEWVRNFLENVSAWLLF